MSLGLIFEIVMQNFAAIRSAVLEKMTFEVAHYGNFAEHSRTEIVTTVLGHGRLDVTSLDCTSCRVTVLVLFVSVKLEARRSVRYNLQLHAHPQIIMKKILTTHCHLSSS